MVLHMAISNHMDGMSEIIHSDASPLTRISNRSRIKADNHNLH